MSQYKSKYMGTQIDEAVKLALDGSLSPVLSEITITENGEFLPAENTDGYSKVTVTVGGEEWDGTGVIIAPIAEEPTIFTFTFTIDGTEYYAEEGMTFAEWIESDYNTSGKDWYLDTSTDYVHIISEASGWYVDASTKIENGGVYRTSNEPV